jgi:hypothetical protein
MTQLRSDKAEIQVEGVGGDDRVCEVRSLVYHKETHISFVPQQTSSRCEETFENLDQFDQFLHIDANKREKREGNKIE